MSRQHKLSLIIGFSLVLVVAIIITDHLTQSTVIESARFDQQPTFQSSPLGTASRIPPGLQAQRESNLTDDGSNASNAAALQGAVERPIISLRDASEAAHFELTTQGELPQGRPGQPDSSRLANEHGGVAGKDTPSDRIHVVREKETLYSLCVLYYGDGSLASELALYNIDRVPENYRIRDGLQLRIPPRDALLGRVQRHTDAQKTPPDFPTGGQARYVSYTIQTGDTLTELAQVHMGTMRRWQELYDLNRDVIRDPDRLIPGTVIRIPRP